LDIAAEISMELSINSLIDAGIYVKNAYALEVIGNLDLIVFDWTKGFTLNEMNLTACMFEGTKVFDIRNPLDIVPNLKLNEIEPDHKKTLIDCLLIDHYANLDKNTNLNAT